MSEPLASCARRAGISPRLVAPGDGICLGRVEGDIRCAGAHERLR